MNTEGKTTQQLCELLAALTLGNEQMDSETVAEVMGQLQTVIDTDTAHYLFLQNPDDLASAFDCGSASQAVKAMVAEATPFRMYENPLETCHYCGPEPIEPDFDEAPEDDRATEDEFENGTDPLARLFGSQAAWGMRGRR